MTIEFQRNILRYLFQYKIEYLDFLQPSLFNIVELKALFELYHNYVRIYKSLPDRGNFNEFLQQQVELTPEAKTFIRNSFGWLYEELKDTAMVEECIIEEVKKTMFRAVIVDLIGTIDTGINSIVIDDAHRKISKINDLSKAPEDPGLYLLKDINKIISHGAEVHPTFLKGLNNLTAQGGFYTPQLIMIMGPPKSYKTGLMIKLATGYMKDGLDVFYADFENGQQAIMQRFKQSLLECHINDIGSFNSELNQIKDKILNFTGGGEVFIKRYEKRNHHMGHIDHDLKKLFDQGMNPKMLFYDYIDVMGCHDKSIKSEIEKIQKNYAEAENINTRYNTFCFTVSKMQRQATFKEVSKATDVAGDFEKIYNAHASFSLNRTEEDIAEGLARLSAIAQRMGSSYQDASVELKIDPIKAIIKEVEI